MSRGCHNFEAHGSKSLDCFEQNVGRNMNVKGISGKSSEGNKEHVTGKWRKGGTLVISGRNLGRNLFCGCVESRTCRT